MEVSKRSLAIFIPKIGIFSEVWAYRQAESFDRMDSSFLAWEVANDPQWQPSGSSIILKSRWTASRIASSLASRSRLFANCFDWLETRSIVASIDSNRFDAAICHFGWTAARAYRALNRLKIPYFVILHGLDISETHLFSRQGKPSLYFVRLIEALRLANGIIVVGSHMKESISTYAPDIPSSKFHCIPCGAPIARFAHSNLNTRSPNETLKVISVGRLFEGKGISDSISAIATVINHGIDVELTIVGDGPERGRLEQAVNEMGLNSKITLSGKKSPEEIQELFASQHIFLQPSKKARNGWVEGFGVSITEAMAAGLPVIATRSGGIPDQVRHEQDGLLVEEGNISAIALCIETLHADERHRLEMASSARERAKQFDSKKLAGKLETLILNACS